MCIRDSVHRDQPRRLRPAQSGHLLHVPPHHSPLAAFQFFIPLLPERLVHPAVYLLPILALESHLSTAVQKCLNLLQAQSFRCLHADGQVPACGFAPPGSSCMRQDSHSLSPSESGIMNVCDKFSSIAGKMASGSPSAPACPVASPRAKRRMPRWPTSRKPSRCTWAPWKSTTCRSLKNISTPASLPCDAPPRHLRQGLCPSPGACWLSRCPPSGKPHCVAP